MRFTLRQVQVFVAIARLESVSRAAESLALSQSAASTSLAELERQAQALRDTQPGKRVVRTEPQATDYEPSAHSDRELDGMMDAAVGPCDD